MSSRAPRPRWGGGLFAMFAVLSSSAGCGGGGGSAAPTIDAPFELAQQSPGAASIAPGGGTLQIVVDVTVDAEAQADGVQLSAVDVPAGMTVTVPPTTLFASGPVTVDVVIDASMPIGTYSFGLRGTSGVFVDQADLAIDIVDAASDYTLGVSPRSVSIENDGDSASVQVAIAAVGAGSAPAATLQVVGLPIGVTVGLGTPGQIEFIPGAAATPGLHDIEVVADANGLERRQSMLLHVMPKRTIDGVELRAPSVLRVRRFSSTSAQVDIRRETGTTGDAVLDLDGAPTGLTVSFAENPARLAASQLLLTADGTAVAGSYQIDVEATVGMNIGTTSVLVQIVDENTPTDPDVRIQRVEFGQNHFDTDPLLVGGKDVLLRAHVVSDLVGTTSPTVTAKAYSSGGALLGTVTMDGPPSLPIGENPSNLSASFTGDLPAAWIDTGLEVRIELDPDGAYTDDEPANDTASVSPRVDVETGITLMLVPLLVGGRTPTIASTDFYRDAMLANWPLSSVNVGVRAPYTVTSVSSVSADGTGWSQVLMELLALRASDSSTAHYYGFIDPTYFSGVAGLGYIGLPASIGWDHSGSALQTLLHELGHNFSLSHAPCGGPSGPDPDFPFAGARIGYWGYDERDGSLISPSSRRDMMSYCGPEWVSGYNYRKAYDWLAPRYAASVANLSAGAMSIGGEGGVRSAQAAGAAVTITGRIAPDGRTSVDRVWRRNGAVSAPTQMASISGLSLRLTYDDGSVLLAPIQSIGSLGCEHDGVRHFVADIAEPFAAPDLVGVEVIGQDTVGNAVTLGVEVAQRPTVLGASAAGGYDGPSVSHDAGDLVVTWDPLRASRADIVHVADDGTRTTLALGVEGGSWRIADGRVPMGGMLEVHLARGLAGALHMVAR